MADVMLELVAEEAEKKPGFKKRRTKQTRGSVSSTRAREEAKRIKEREKAARTDGMEQLRREADIRVGRNAAKLAELLTKTALKGDLHNMKALVGLAEKKKKTVEPVQEKAMLPFLRCLNCLEKQPEWKGPMKEEFGEVGEGGVEPEGGGR